MQSLYVFYQQKYVGELKKLGARQLQFQYHPAWLADQNAFALSISLPLRPQPFENAQAFFSNLLPEGEVRSLLCKKLGLSDKNDFGLLAEVGGDIAGAIAIYTVPEAPSVSNQMIELSKDKLASLLAALEKTPFKALDGEIRLSLAGAQNKLPVMRLDKFDTPFALPISPDLATTHIIKLAHPQFDDLVLNELTTMRFAKALGLNVPEVDFLPLAGKTHFLIQRYDRHEGQRLHQEDFCQALAIEADNKYEAEGGPSLKQCAELIRLYSCQPAVDLLQFIRWVLFNVLVGNHDAHGKNIAFVYTPKCRLAPFYDLLSTQCYPSLSQKFSMKMGGENRLQWLQKKHLERFADDIEVKFGLVQKELEKLLALVEKHGVILEAYPALKEVVNHNRHSLIRKLKG